jgi:hypothetical protein
MNWQEIINNSELVYASTQEDKHFRTWSLKKTTCNVSFYESYPIDDIDKIVCSILEKTDGILPEEELATVLGFNVVDNFDITPKRYADKAELDIFRAIVKPVLDWGLVERITEKEKPVILQLTDLGYRALQAGEKYKFYTGQKKLLENPNIKPAESQENMFFPFYSVLGEYTEITESRQIPYSNINPAEIFDIEETELIRRHRLQSNKEYPIYKSEPTMYFEFGSCQVEIRLFRQNDDYYPIIFYNNQICVEATELLNKPDNIKEKEKKVEWGLYLKLIKDPDAVLDYKTIIPFEDLLELDSLIKDTRLVWADNQLFKFIAENADANQWFAISNHCPVEVIKSHIDKYKDKWDWTSLSVRIDDDFLIDNATNYPWNFEAISAKEEISIEVIKTLLLIPELREQEWDWDRIMPQLDFDFIKTNIDKIDFELSELTVSNSGEVQPLIALYPDKRWNWTYISAEYSLNWISDNILKFSKYMQIKTIINRAFTSDEYVDLFCKSDDFKSLLIQLKETTLRDYSPNQAQYQWNNALIDFLEQTDYLSWESGNFTLGFECNPFIEWTSEYFKQYHSKVTTAKGFSFVSEKISGTNIVLDFQDFSWDWNVISTNINLINDNSFIFKVSDKLNFALLLKFIDGSTIEALFEQANLLSFLENNPESWQSVTEKCSIEFVRKHIDYDWDWAILTKRFCPSIKIEALGNSKWVDKWNWKYLTRNLDIAQIYDNLDVYVDYWDWEYLSETLDKDFIINNLPDYNNNWYWDTLLNKRLDKSDLLFTTQLAQVATCISILEDEVKSVLWQIITHKFDYTELEGLIEQSYQTVFSYLFQWDYDYFYNLPEFNVRQYLNKNVNLVNWSALSLSEALNKTFFLDKSLYSFDVWFKDVSAFLKNDTYHWDFKGLSKLDNINRNDSFLEIKTKEWDWDYLSEFSGCFKKGEKFVHRFRKFINDINFQTFSKRTDSDITEDLIAKNIGKNWDWNALSENNSIKFSIDFIKQNKDKQWNWNALSNRQEIKLDNETLIELSDKEWDWELISKRTDITFDEIIIEKLNSKPLDWFVVSQNTTFQPTAKTLSLLKGESLDWNAISQNKNLPLKILWDYRDNLNWEYVTENKIDDITNLETLKKYQDYVDWRFVSQSEKFKTTIGNLKEFKDKLEWNIINQRNDFNITQEMLEQFANVLNWTSVSKSMEISFTEELIEKYRNYLDWQSLRSNPIIIERLNTTLSKYKAEFNCVGFLERFQHTTPCIYHFTHLFNAIDIIKSRKILSRNKAEGHFSNAAGNLVARRSTAHNFARFYFRPQTPTQFYNECLGMDSQSGYLKTWRYWDGDWIECSKWKSYYPQARNLGLPKCPIPVFFKFDLKEVIMKMSDKCFYSTGNMQTNWARVEKVSENPNSINTAHLYSTVSDFENYKQYSQQEFLVEEEFDFSTLDSFKIICYNEEYANLLKAQLGNDPICDKIISDGWDIFHRDNRQLFFHETETEISISSEYRDDAYLSIQGPGLHNIQVLNPDSIQKETVNEIFAYPEIRFKKTDKPIEVRFVDLATGNRREWLIYKN